MIVSLVFLTSLWGNWRLAACVGGFLHVSISAAGMGLMTKFIDTVLWNSSGTVRDPLG